MHQALKDAITICKTFLRNGYDAHVINAPLQEHLLRQGGVPAVDIACEPDLDTLVRLFPAAVPEREKRALAVMEQDGVTYRFYPLEVAAAGHPELSLLRVTPTMIDRMSQEEKLDLRLTGFGSPERTATPTKALPTSRAGPSALRACRTKRCVTITCWPCAPCALRPTLTCPLSPIPGWPLCGPPPACWTMCPPRTSWTNGAKVAAESMYRFVRLLYDAHILQGLIPEVAALSCLTQMRNKEGDTENVFEHTLACMRHYPEEDFHYDWLGTMAMLFHDVGKLYTGEFFDGPVDLLPAPPRGGQGYP